MNNSNPVSSQDVTYLSMSMASFAGAAAALSAHDYIVAAGSVVLGILLTYLYHRFGSPSVPEGTLPVTVPNPSGGTLASPTTPITVSSPVNPAVTVNPTTPSTTPSV